MKKALLAAAVAVAAVAGVVLAVVVSSGGEKKPAAPATTGALGVPTTTRPATSGTTATTSAPTTTRSATAPVDAPPRLPPPPGPQSERRTLVVGVVDDALAQQSRSFAQAQMDTSRDAGFAPRVSATWSGASAVRRRPPHALGNVAAAAKADMELFVVAWHGLARDTPQTPAQRADFAACSAALVKALPAARSVIVGNEPNLGTFWQPQFGAGGGTSRRWVRGPARPQLRRDQGRRSRRPGHRRRARPARGRPSTRLEADALADGVHPRPRAPPIAPPAASGR